MTRSRRSLPLIVMALPGIAAADVFSLQSQITGAEIYPSGATITREVPFSIPPGSHRIELTDLPLNTPLETLRVSVSGASLGTISTRRAAVPVTPAVADSDVEAAKAAVARAEEDLARILDQATLIRARTDAAEARLSYISAQKPSDEATPDILSGIADVISSQTLTATQDIVSAGAELRALQPTIDAARDRARDARDALSALLSDADRPRAFVSVALSSEDAAEGVMTLSYVTPDAGWMPSYDIALDRKDRQVQVDRGAMVMQTTGENWDGVRISLSTARPAQGLAPATLHPRQMWISEDVPPVAYGGRLTTSDRMAVEEAAPASPAIMADIVEDSVLDGISLTYAYPQPVDLVSGPEAVHLALGQVTMGAEIYARAVPARDSTAFVEASVTNGSGETILPTSEARFTLDGQYVGRGPLDMIAPGAQAQLPFGPIVGLTLTERQPDRETGDRGVISRSNQRQETYRYEITNSSGTEWDIRLLAQVPYSEQEDLTIRWEADPRPAETDLDGEKGILEWRFPLPPGASRDISVSQTIRWPEGYILR